jgi:uncharacterized membrane protein
VEAAPTFSLGLPTDCRLEDLMTTPSPAPSPAPATGTGLTPNLAGALSYLLSPLTGIVFFILEKENQTVRFHAMQSIMFGVAWIVLWIALHLLSLALFAIPIVGWLVAALIWLGIGCGGFILWVLLMWKAYRGEEWELPVIGPMARKQLTASSSTV